MGKIASGMPYVVDSGTKERGKMTVRLSLDEGKTWPVAKLLHAGPKSV